MFSELKLRRASIDDLIEWYDLNWISKIQILKELKRREKE